MRRKTVSAKMVRVKRTAFFVFGMIILIPVYIVVSVTLVQFMCVFLIFILLVSRIYSEYLARNIQVIRLDSELRVFRHEWVHVELRAENHGLLPAFMLLLGDTPGKLSVFKDRKMLCTLLRRSWLPFRWQGYCSERGVFNLGPVIVQGADPLGLFPFVISFSETTRLFVYPAFRSIMLDSFGGIPLGNKSAANPLFEDITLCRSLRPYQSGDELRRINWKASAHMSHTSGFMVNEYEATATRPLMIFLNLNRFEYPENKQRMFIERVIEAATALCLRTSREQQYLGIILFTSAEKDDITVITPAAHTLVPILERLASLDWNKAKHTETTHYNSARAMFDHGKFLPYGTRFLYVGSDLGDKAYIRLNLLKKYHLTLEYLVINEKTLPPLVPGNSPRYQIQERGYEIVSVHKVGYFADRPCIFSPKGCENAVFKEVCL